MSFNTGGGSGPSNVYSSGDVALNNTANADILTYDTTVGKWKNQVPVVRSVAGKTGAVSLATSDIPNLTSDLASKVQAVGGGIEAVVTASPGTTYTVNLANANMFVLTLSANCTLTLSGATAGKACSITLLLKQDATGNRTLNWPTSVKWSGGTAPTLTTTGNKVDFINLLTHDGGTVWYGFTSGKNY